MSHDPFIFVLVRREWLLFDFVAPGLDIRFTFLVPSSYLRRAIVRTCIISIGVGTFFEKRVDDPNDLFFSRA